MKEQILSVFPALITLDCKIPFTTFYYLLGAEYLNKQLLSLEMCDFQQIVKIADIMLLS